MARPRKSEQGIKAQYHTSAKAKAWLVCRACDLSIPYSGNSDPEHGDGWPQHRCAAKQGKPMPFTGHTTTDPHPPPPLPVWDEPSKPEPAEVIIG